MERRVEIIDYRITEEKQLERAKDVFWGENRAFIILYVIRETRQKALSIVTLTLEMLGWKTSIAA